MPQQKSRWTVDPTNLESTLELYVGAVLVTTYTYAAGVITLSERPNEDVISLDTTRENVRLIERWQNIIQSEFGSNGESIGEYKQKAEKTSDEYTAKLEIGVNDLANVTYNHDDGEFTFKPRDEVELTYREFTYYVRFLTLLIREAEGF